MRLKSVARDVVWSIRGRRYRNPDWPAQVNSVLYVCYGNICRSPFAERLTAQLLTQAGVGGVRCTSAGFRANQRSSSPADAIQAAAVYQVGLDDNRPRLLTYEMVKAHDVVFVMEPAHLAELLRRWPDERRRYFLMPLFDTPPDSMGAYDRLHFVDPFGRGDEAFAQSYARIARAVGQIVSRWSR